MCFEFEALYWAKLTEEEQKKKEADRQRKAAQGGGSKAAGTTAKPQTQPASDEDLLPV